MDKKPVKSVLLNEDIISAVERKAKLTDRSFSYVVRKILTEKLIGKI